MSTDLTTPDFPNAKGATGATGWDYFPLVMCINLKERNDRLEEARAEFAKVGLEKVSFFRSERQVDRDKAIIDSHMACLRHAVEKNVPYALIFEDDVAFTPEHEVHLKRAIDFLEARPDCNLFHLGGFVFRKAEWVTPHIVRGGILTLHAYVIRTEFAKKLLAERRFCSGMSVDLFYTAINGNASFVHVAPLICTQRASQSDGTWDTRDLNKSGWLGTAMEFTALPFREQLRFDRFPWMERLRIRNGMSFFVVFRAILKRKLAKARKKGIDMSGGDGPGGEWIEATISAPGLQAK